MLILAEVRTWRFCYDALKKDCFFSRAEHVVAAAAYLHVYFVGWDDGNSGNKVLEASHGKWMHMHWNMRCAGKPSAEVTIFGTMRPKVYFSHRSASTSPRTLTDCLLLWLSQSKYSLFSSTAFTPRKTHAVFSDPYSNRCLNKVLVKATGTALPKQSIDLQKNSTFRPLSAASFSFLLTLTHPRMFQVLDGR